MCGELQGESSSCLLSPSFCICGTLILLTLANITLSEITKSMFSEMTKSRSCMCVFVCVSEREMTDRFASLHVSLQF